MVSLFKICDRLLLSRPEQDILVANLAALNQAGPEDISFIVDAKHTADAQACQAKVLICPPNLALPQFKGIKLTHENPYLAYALISQLFNQAPAGSQSIHASAVVDPTARLADNVSIGANAVIGANVELQPAVVIAAGVVIEDGVSIGVNSQIHANAMVAYNCIIGDNCIVDSGTVIGSDGFGFAPNSGQWQKIYQNAAVRIGNNVHIGANSTIDRGALNDTVIESNVIIDNLVQIAHNVHIGESTAIAAQTGIAGRTKIGANCTIAGQCGFAGHLTIADGCFFTGQAMVTKSISEKGMYSSGVPVEENKKWRKMVARLRKLDALVKQVNLLQKQNKK